MPRDYLGIAWIAASAIQYMKAEADRAMPKETGGVLLGYWSADRTDVVVTECVGPGSKAVHRRSTFVPDHAYHEREVARAYRASGRSITYLGDWHSHPFGPLRLSTADLLTQIRIGRSATARAPEGLMLIIAESEPWKFGIWRLERTRRMLERLRFVSPMVIREYPDDPESSLTESEI